MVCNFFNLPSSVRQQIRAIQTATRSDARGRERRRGRANHPAQINAASARRRHHPSLTAGSPLRLHREGTKRRPPHEDAKRPHRPPGVTSVVRSRPQAPVDGSPQQRGTPGGVRRGMVGFRSFYVRDCFRLSMWAKCRPKQLLFPTDRAPLSSKTGNSLGVATQQSKRRRHEFVYVSASIVFSQSETGCVSAVSLGAGHQKIRNARGPAPVIANLERSLVRLSSGGEFMRVS